MSWCFNFGFIVLLHGIQKTTVLITIYMFLCVFSFDRSNAPGRMALRVSSSSGMMFIRYKTYQGFKAVFNATVKLKGEILYCSSICYWKKVFTLPLHRLRLLLVYFKFSRYMHTWNITL